MQWYCYKLSTGKHIDQSLHVLFRNIWLENFPTQFKTVVYRGYDDDTFFVAAVPQNM